MEVQEGGGRDADGDDGRAERECAAAAAGDTPLRQHALHVERRGRHRLPLARQRGHCSAAMYWHGAKGECGEGDGDGDGGRGLHEGWRGKVWSCGAVWLFMFCPSDVFALHGLYHKACSDYYVSIEPLLLR